MGMVGSVIAPVGRLRAGALAAVAGGGLRIAASFAPAALSAAAARDLYATVDACLAASLIAFYSIRGLRRSGAIGLTMALAGIAVVRMGAALSMVRLYPAGALAVAIGVVAFSSSLRADRRVPGWLPVAFGLSMLLGVAGSGVAGADRLFVLSGVLFGVAFAGLGVHVWKTVVAS
jgi:hypothetical protein